MRRAYANVVLLEASHMTTDTALSAAEITDYFSTAPIKIRGNLKLRIPQVGAYHRVMEHFKISTEPAICVMPVGSGKSGTIGLLPYRMARGRVLVIAPNVEIKEGLLRSLSFDSRQECFFIDKDILTTNDCPEVAELKTGASVHDADAAHIVVTNIQQLSTPRWADSFPQDYFEMILVDEGHHAAAESWGNAFARFPQAKVVHLTGTPFRADGQDIPGVEVYRFKIVEAIINNYLKRPRFVEAEVEQITFSHEGEKQTFTLEQIHQNKDETWFSKGCALANECNKTIVDQSIELLETKRKSWGGHKIIASACNIGHAEKIVALYNARKVPATWVHSNMSPEQIKANKDAFHRGDFSVMVQVDMLGEGYDHPPISIAAVFRPYRSLNAFIQFIGRGLRWIPGLSPDDNLCHIVTHPGLNLTRMWEGFKSIDKADQELVRYIVGETTEEPKILQQADEIRQREPAAYMIVEDEVVKAFTDVPFLDQIEEAAIDQFMLEASDLGFDLEKLGLNRDKLLTALKEQKQFQHPANQIRVRKQEERELLNKQLNLDVRKAGALILQRLGMRFDGDDLVEHFPEEDENGNIAIVMRLVNRAVNGSVDQLRKTRKDWASAQYTAAMQNLGTQAEIVLQEITKRISG